MKNKKIFIRIYVLLLLICIIFVITASLLGSKTRIGYLSGFELNVESTLKYNNLYNAYVYNIDDKENYIFTNNNITNYFYNFRISYYDKVFRNSDIYAVYPNFNNLPQYIDKAELYGIGQPFGYCISSKKIDNIDFKIDNIEYTLKVKNIYIINILLSIVIFIFLLKRKEIINYINNLNSKKIDIKLSTLMTFSYLYLLLPYLIFIITYTKYQISIPVSILLLIILFLIIRDAIKNYNSYYSVSMFSLIIISIMIIAIIIISGIGEVFPQNIDMRLGRNAFFRDLVNFSWPIIYPESGFGFVYYFAHWVIPSIFGKIFGFTVAKIALVIWTYIGTILSFLLIINFLKIEKNFAIFTALIIFILYSGIYPYAGGIRIDYTSIIDQMSYIFNQSIGIWIMCILFLHQRNSSNFAFLGLIVVFYSPYAILGIIPFMIVKVIIDIKNNHFKELKNIFSLVNILSSIAIFPILFLYLSSGDTMNDGFKLLLKEHNYIRLFFNSMFGFGLFAIFLYKYNKNNYIFYVSIFIFLAVSMIRYSYDHNFSRVNLPSMFFFSILTIEYFNKYMDFKTLKSKIFLTIFIFASIQSILFFEKQIDTFISEKVSNYKTNIGNETFNISYNNFVLRTITCQNIDKSIFFKYIANDKK